MTASVLAVHVIDVRRLDRDETERAVRRAWLDRHVRIIVAPGQPAPLLGLDDLASEAETVTVECSDRCTADRWVAAMTARTGGTRR